MSIRLWLLVRWYIIIIIFSNRAISDRLVGFRITEKFIELLDHIDPDSDRPWSMLYSESYFDEIFTKDMATRLTSIWEGITGNFDDFCISILTRGN